MAFSAIFYRHSKRGNSTSIPPADAGVTYDVELLDDTSILNPTLKMRMAWTESKNIYNMVYIPQFVRYYHVIDFTYNKGFWYVSCRVDVLASWRSQIGNSTQYVVRASAVHDGNIVDTFFPATADIKLSTSNQSTGWYSTLNSGYYVVGIINRSSSASAGVVTYYVMSTAQLATLRNALMGNVDWLGNVADISTQLLKAQFNPLQYIVSCKWFPFAPPTGSSVKSISYGWWNLEGVSASLLANTPIHTDAFSITLPKHPNSESRGRYLNLHPYSTYNLEFRPFGFFALDTTYLTETNNVYMQTRTDCLTGISTLTISPDTGYKDTLLTSQCNLGVDIQLAQMSADYLGSATAAVGAVESLVTGNITGALSSIASAANSIIPQVQKFNTNGGVSDFSYGIHLYARFMIPVSDYNGKMGRPYCKPIKIDDITGYILCENASISSIATKNEADAIIEYLNGGFYYE